MSIPARAAGNSCDFTQQEHPPTVHFDTRTGHVRSVTLMRFCIACGYTEIGQVPVNRDPIWRTQEDEGERDA